jgi:hypothetical protein
MAFCLKGKTETIINQDKMQFALDDAKARQIRRQRMKQPPRGGGYGEIRAAMLGHVGAVAFSRSAPKQMALTMLDDFQCERNRFDIF